ncbi:hypothetical protein STEG23_033592 [Scotinomys teguina]
MPSRNGALWVASPCRPTYTVRKMEHCQERRIKLLGILVRKNSLPDLYKVNVINVDNDRNYSFKKAGADTTLPISITLVSDSSFTYKEFCPKTSILTPRVILHGADVHVTWIHPHRLSADLYFSYRCR